jgi:death-on-curing protein
MRYLALSEALELHSRLIEASGGAHGVRDLGLLESALAQPRLTFDGNELYADAIAKAGALGFSLIQNHAFVDGNERAARRG